MENKICYILGSGASIRENLWDVKIEHIPIIKALKNRYVITLNWGYKFIKPTIALFVDYRFYATEYEKLKNLPLLVGKDDGFYIREKEKYKKHIDNNLFLLPDAKGKNVKETGMTSHYWGNRDCWTNGFYTAQLSGLFALSIAIGLGFKKIYLLGYDGTDTNGYTHFYQDDNVTGHITWQDKEETGVGKDKNGNFRTDNYNKSMDKWFIPFKDELNNIQIINVNKDSAINVFPKISYKEFYKDIENDTLINNSEYQELTKQIIKKKRNFKHYYDK